MRPTRMRKGVLTALVAVAAVLALAFPATAFAEHLNGRNNWLVTFTSDGKLTDNFSSKQWADDVGGLQPGDDITFTINLSHKNSTACDWYIANDVIKSLEDGAASGSAYGYVLTYTGPSGTSRTLYNSGTVGGENSGGLTEATSGLKDFLYLDNLKKDQTGVVKLLVSLDGETEGNAYFNTLAQLKMKFAVEYSRNNNNGGSSSGSNNRTAVQTGDDTRLFPFYVVMAVTGFALLLIAIFLARRNRRERAATTGGGVHRR